MVQMEEKQQIKIFVLMFMVLALEYIISIPKCLDDVYQVPSYVMRYQDVGFINRGLIGTLTRFVFGDVITNQNILTMSTFAMVLILLFISYIFSHLYVQYKETQYSNLLLFLFLIYWLLPVGWHSYYQGSFMIHLEVYVVVINLIAFISFWMIKAINLKMFIYSVLSVVAMLIHTNYLFMGFPFILFYLVMDYFQQESRKKYLLKVAFLTIFVCGFFLFVQFSSVICMTFDEIVEYIKLHYSGYELDSVVTGEEWNYMPWYHLMLYNYYYSDFFMCLMENLQIYYKSMIIGGMETIVIVSPVIFFIARTNNKIRLSDNKELKIVTISSLVFALCFLPLFALTVDYGRWFTLLFMYLAITYFTILFKYKDELEKCGYLLWAKCFVEKNKLWIVCLLLLYSALGKINLINLWPKINEIFVNIFVL